MIAMILKLYFFFKNKRNTQTITAVMPALVRYPMLALLQGGSSLAQAQRKTIHTIASLFSLSLGLHSYFFNAN